MNNHNSTVPAVTRLIEAFHRLPGVGPKTAQRYTYHLIKMPEEIAKEFSEAILGIKEKITFCNLCSNISQEEICLLCSNTNRDNSKICVVEEPLDIIPIERTRAYNGLYQVLHGVISPMNKVLLSPLAKKIEISVDGLSKPYFDLSSIFSEIVL